MRPGQKIGPRQKNTLTFASESVIISRHSTECRVYRGIAQLVEQRSPKPRAVSSRLTTPAKSTVPAGAVLFLYPEGAVSGKISPDVSRLSAHAGRSGPRRIGMHLPSAIFIQ